MQGEIVTTKTSDHLKLHGIYCTPVVKPKTRFEAAVLTHGLASNFYSSRFLNYLAHSLLDLGIHVVIGNTRGHDDINRSVKAAIPIYQGAAYEQVSDCQYDLAAWNQFLASRGHQRNIYAGHSLGAIKSLYAHAFNRQSSIEAIVCFSATRLNHRNLMKSQGAEKFKAMLEQATSLVDVDQANELMNVTFPFPTKMTAGAYLDKYGADRYDWFEFINKVDVPTLLTFGSIELEQNAAFEGLREEFETLKSDNEALTIHEIEKADHFYGGKFEEAATVMKDWLLATDIC